MAIAVASLFVSLALVSGFQKVYKESILKFNAHLVITRSDEIADLPALTDRLPEGLKREIVGWNPFLYREGMLISGTLLKGIVIKGADLASFEKYSGMKIEAGSGRGLVLGNRLRAEIGDRMTEVKILFPQGEGGQKVERFPVRGGFSSGLYEYDSSFALLSLEEAQRFFQMGNKVSGIEIWLRDPDRAAAWVDRLRQDFEFPYTVMGWREINENLFRALEMEKVLFFILMIFLAAVASLNILASLIMLILKKRGEIAILRAIGFPWRLLQKIFLFDGLLIGSAGLGLGLALGIGILLVLEVGGFPKLSPEIYFVSTVPIDYRWENLLMVVAGALSLVGLGCRLTLRGLKDVPVLKALEGFR